jgi:plastocyanin
VACAGLVWTCVSGCSNASAPTAKGAHSGRASASTVDGVQQVRIRATDFRFTPSTIMVHPGKVRIVLVNDGPGAPHDWQLRKFPHDRVPLTNKGESKQTTFTAPPPGRYIFECTIHVRQGMTGTLVVVPR